MSLLEGRSSLRLGEATGALLEQLAARERRLVLVTGRSPGLGEAFAGVAPERWVVAPGRGTRLAVGAGMSLTGWDVVVRCEDVGDALTAPWDLAHSLVALTAEPAVASACWEAGLPVLLPAWPVDVGSLLLAGLEHGRACLLLHDEEVAPSPPLALDPPSLTTPRTVTHGAAARVAAGGALMPALLEVAWRLARRGHPITAQQLTCLGAAGPGPREAARHVFWHDGERWEALPVAGGDFRAVEAAVTARLGV